MIGEHRSALRFDFRDRLRLSLDDVGESVPWGEAIDLIIGLAADPATRTCASIQEWDHPLSREAMLLADLYDITHLIATDPKKRNRVKPHPVRPWKSAEVKKYGNAAGRERSEVVAILDAAARGELAA